METLFWISLGIAGGYALGNLVFALRRRSGRDRVAALVDEKDYFDLLIERLPDGFIILDENWTIIRVNDAYCRMTGRSREELVGVRPPYPGWAPEERKAIEARMPGARQGDLGPFELSYVRPDGERVPFEYSPGVLRTKDGRPHVFAIVKDLTEQKDREAKLKESEALFRRIAETSTDAIYQLDVSGKVTYCSPQVETVLGYAQDEFIGTSFRAHFLPEDLPVADDAFVKNLSGVEIRNTELRILNKNKKPILIEVNATPIRKDGRVIGSQGMARDITEGKAAENSLRASEARLRTIIESVPFDFFLIDEDGRYAMENATLRETWGTGVIGKRPEDLGVDDKTLALWLENNRRAFAGEVVEGEVSFQVRGEERHFHNIISPIREGGKIRGILGVNIDVTERKRTEEALRQSEEKYRFLVENTGTAVTLWDVEGRLMLINRMAARYLDRAPEDLVGRSVHELAPPRVVEPALAVLRSVVDSREGTQSESEVDLPGGKRWFRSYLQPVSDSEGKFFGVQVVSHDITELMRAEQSLRERDARLRLMVSQLPAIVWTVDRELRFTSSAGAGLKALGLAPGQVVGTTLFEYFGTRDPGFEPIEMHRRSLRGEATTFEMVWNGSIWETHAEPLRSEAGEIIGCLAIGLDVTRRRQAESELRRSREQLRALAGKLQDVREEESTKIAREIHDELGQALTGIKYGVSFIERRLPQCGEADSLAELENKIEEMSREIDATIDTVRRISTELRPKVLDDMDLAGAIEWQAQDFQRRSSIICDVNQYGKAWELNLDPPRSTAVFRIFQEILTNVRRHAGATHVWVDLRREDESFLLEVRDNGRGFSQKDMRRVDSLGILGMSERAQVFGGEVLIESEPGQGTSVKVMIPLGE